MEPGGWCPTCSEACTDHPDVCTVCGDELIPRSLPTSTADAAASFAAASAAASFAATSASAAAPSRGPPIAAAAAAGRANMSSAETDTVLAMMGAHRAASAAAAARDARAMGPDGQRTLLEAVRAASGGDGGDEWQAPPPEALDPQAASTKPTSRPTSRECIDRIPRIVVDSRSSILHECTVDILPPPKGPFGGCGGGGGNVMKRKAHRFDAIVAEFGPAPPYLKTGRLVLANPLTAKGGTLGPGTVTMLEANTNFPTIAYLERGDDVTFVRKALLAQQAGASAVLIGNNVGVWPYVMRDSTGEALDGLAPGKSEDGGAAVEENSSSSSSSSSAAAAAAAGAKGLTIPVVMVKRSDGKQIRSVLELRPGCTTRCTISANKIAESGDDSKDGAGGAGTAAASSTGDCVVCRESFRVGDTVLRLPFCAHSFHEPCALSWLEKHNTCPYCRRELPTDDEEYEAERRRVSRTHAAASSSSGGGGDGGLHESQWETLFG